MEILEVKKHLVSLINLMSKYIEDYRKYATECHIPYNFSILDNQEQQLSFLEETTNKLAEFCYRDEITIRYILSQLSSIFSTFSWRSNSYDEAIHSNSFQPELLSTKKVNYSRYDHFFLDKIESYIKNLYSIPDNYECLVTSSGMSAFDITLQYLIGRNKLGTIYIPRYIYFESYQQIRNFALGAGLDIQNGGSEITEDGIIEHIIKYQPSVIFLDPRTNTAYIKELNIKYIFEQIKERLGYSPIFVVDVSMIGIDIDFCYQDNFEVITYMSGSKYLSFGLDMSMMGMVICKKSVGKTISLLRRNTGAMLYENSCLLFPIFGKKTYLSRLDSLEETAISLYQELTSDEIIKTFFELSYPEKSGYKFKGAIVTINFKDKNMRRKELYSEIIDSLIRLGKEEGVPIVHGVSFGFSTTRVSASDVMSGEEDVFLRVSCGVREYYNLPKLSYIFKKSLYAIINHS